MGINSPHRKPRKTDPDPTGPVKAKRGQGKRLTLTERLAILAMRQAHPEWSYSDLARAAGVHHETARVLCMAAGRDAADLMAAYAAPMFRRWRKAAMVASTRGDHRPAREWLLHAGVVEPLPDSTRGGGAAVVIINNPLPGMPGYLPAQPVTLGAIEVPALSVSPVILAPGKPPVE